MLRLLRSLVAVVALVTVTAVAADEPIKDRRAWLDSAFEHLHNGEVEKFQALLDKTLGQEMHNDVVLAVMPLQDLVGKVPAQNVDLLNVQKLGKSFELYDFAAYYGGRDFLFYRFIFAKLGKTWHLWSVDFSEELPN